MVTSPMSPSSDTAPLSLAALPACRGFAEGWSRPLLGRGIVAFSGPALHDRPDASGEWGSAGGAGRRCLPLAHVPKNRPDDGVSAPPLAVRWRTRVTAAPLGRRLSIVNFPP